MMSIFRHFKTKLSAALAVLLSVFSTPALANRDAQFQQAIATYQTGNHTQAFQLFQQLAQQGDAESQYTLGWFYEDGLGVAQDNQQAVAWYQKAANQGYAQAQYNLGAMYENGKGVKQDSKQAFAWYQKAANQGFAAAQFNLGAMYDNGQGVAQDAKQAMHGI